MNTRVITISREFGSGGRTIARTVAERLGYTYYDSALVDLIAAESGYSKDFIERHGEDANATNSFLFNLSRAGSGAYDGAYGVSDKLYVIQHNLLRRLAGQEPCVILGRCADYILRDCPDALHVFIYADTAFKAERIVSLYGETDDAPEKRLIEKDKRRKVYYKNYTGRTWGMSANYDLSLNSGKLGVDVCAEIITALARTGRESRN